MGEFLGGIGILIGLAAWWAAERAGKRAQQSIDLTADMIDAVQSQLAALDVPRDPAKGHNTIKIERFKDGEGKDAYRRHIIMTVGTGGFRATGHPADLKVDKPETKTE